MILESFFLPELCQVLCPVNNQTQSLIPEIEVSPVYFKKLAEIFYTPSFF